MAPGGWAGVPCGLVFGSVSEADFGPNPLHSRGAMQTPRDLQETVETITVDLGDRSYPILIGRNILGRLPELIAQTGAKGAAGLISDAHVDPLYGDAVAALVEEAGMRPVRHTMPAGEEHKRLARIEEICGTFLEGGLDRASLVIALGGGVVGDTAGFAAATFMRGKSHESRSIADRRVWAENER